MFVLNDGEEKEIWSEFQIMDRVRGSSILYGDILLFVGHVMTVSISSQGLMAKFVAKSVFLRRERNIWSVLQRQQGMLDRSNERLALKSSKAAGLLGAEGRGFGCTREGGALGGGGPPFEGEPSEGVRRAGAVSASGHRGFFPRRIPHQGPRRCAVRDPRPEYPNGSYVLLPLLHPLGSLWLWLSVLFDYFLELRRDLNTSIDTSGRSPRPWIRRSPSSRRCPTRWQTSAKPSAPRTSPRVGLRGAACKP